MLSLILSIVSLFLAGYACNINIKMFKRQGVINLHEAWKGVNEIDKDNIITDDVVKANNALSLTASLWNHDIIEKAILYEQYWPAYQQLYEQLDSIKTVVPKTNRSGQSYITSVMKKVYKEMEKMETSQVKGTRL